MQPLSIDPLAESEGSKLSQQRNEVLSKILKAPLSRFSEININIRRVPLSVNEKKKSLNAR